MLLPVHVILNVLAGTPANANDVICQRVHDLFQQQDIHPCISLAHSGSEVRRLAQRAVQERYQTVVAGGGDGTINAVASALVETEVALGSYRWARSIILPKTSAFRSAWKALCTP